MDWKPAGTDEAALLQSTDSCVNMVILREVVEFGYFWVDGNPLHTKAIWHYQCDFWHSLTEKKK